MKKVVSLLCIILMTCTVNHILAVPNCRAPCPPPCAPCAPCPPCNPCAPCAPVCGAECGISLCAVGVAVLAIIGAAALILSSGESENAH